MVGPKYNTDSPLASPLHYSNQISNPMKGTSMSATFIQVTELPVAPGQITEAEKAWLNLDAPTGSHERTLYRHENDDSLLELAAFNAWPDLPGLSSERATQWAALGSLAAGDFRREVLEIVEEPKPTSGPLPDAAHLQMRYVEVRPPVYKAYRQWREETIFDVVRTAPEVKTFSAYHTAFSAKPGVMFLSGFDGNIEDYRAVFSSKRYQEIVQAAGDNYITGGNNGLATRIFVRSSE